MGTWARRNYELPDARLVQAEREIYKTYGDVVSVDKKSKSLIKFGKSANLTTGEFATVWTRGGNETYLTDNLIDRVASGSVLDVYQVTFEGHTVSGTGHNQKFTFVSQTITLTGQTPVVIPIPMARVSRAYNANGVDLVGTVRFYENSAVTNGVPDDIDKVHLDIPAPLQQSFKAATTFSDNEYFILTGGFGSVSLKQVAVVDFYIEVKSPGGVFRQQSAVSASSSSGPWQIDLDPAIIIPRNCDVRVRCETATNGAVAFVHFKGYLAEVIT